MGTGDAHLERELEYLPVTLPRRAAATVGFDERMAHRLMAAADVLVVPSRFEPCGLVALAGLRYGAVPVVASTGGLRDIVSGRFLLEDTGAPVCLSAPLCLCSWLELKQAAPHGQSQHWTLTPCRQSRQALSVRHPQLQHVHSMHATLFLNGRAPSHMDEEHEEIGKFSAAIVVT
jgi:hypothetical protein